MDFKTQGQAIIRQKEEAWTGFQQTIQPDKIYSKEDMEIKSKWVKKIDKVNEVWRLWLSSISKKICILIAATLNKLFK